VCNFSLQISEKSGEKRKYALPVRKMYISADHPRIWIVTKALKKKLRYGMLSLDYDKKVIGEGNDGSYRLFWILLLSFCITYVHERYECWFCGR